MSGTLVGGAGSGAARWVPMLAWFPRYQRSWLRSDLIAAATVWAVVVPQAIAYGQIAGLPPQSGLFAAAAGTLAYAVLGTSRQLVVSPTSSTAAISASLVGALALGASDRYLALSAALALCVGVVFVLMGLARLGFVSRFIPHAVSVGFMFGLGMTIIVGQSTKLLGVPETDGTFFAQLGDLIGSLGLTDPTTLVVGVVSLAVLLVGPRLVPAVPWPLVVVIGSIVAVAALDLTARGVAVIGAIDAAVPRLVVPSVPAGDFLALVPGAMIIAIVGFAEGQTLVERFADQHRYEVRADQELIATGGANILSGLFQGFIVGGGASQSAAADRAGARTQLASPITAALIVLTSVALLPLFRDLPHAALGAIVIGAVVGFLRVDELRRIARLRRDSFWLAMAALVATLLLGILPGLFIATILALVTLLIHFARPIVEDRTPRVTTVRAAAPGGAVVLRLDAPLLFLNAGLLRDRVRAAARAPEPPSAVIVDLRLSLGLDIGSGDMLIALTRTVREDGSDLWLAAVRLDVREALIKAAPDGDETTLPLIFATVEEALDTASASRPSAEPSTETTDA